MAVLNRQKTVAAGMVALLVAMSAVVFMPSDESDAASIYASAEVIQGGSVDLAAAEASLSKTGSATFIAKAGYSVGLIKLQDSSGSTVSASLWSYTVANNQFLFDSGTLPTGTYTLELGAFKGAQVLCYYSIEVKSPVTLSVSDAVVIAGTSYSSTPVSSGHTVSVSGASWLSASGNTISGTPSDSDIGTYTVTVSCDGQTATFTISVISKLAPTNTPANGVIIMPS